MVLTEEEARTRWCPFSPGDDRFGSAAACLGSRCMAWRWRPGEDTPTDDPDLLPVIALLRQDRFINAIKEYRSIMRVTLKEAKDAIDLMRADLKGALALRGYCGLAERYESNEYERRARG